MINQVLVVSIMEKVVTDTFNTMTDQKAVGPDRIPSEA